MDSENVPKITYQPKYKETQIEKFKKFVERKHNIELVGHFPGMLDCVCVSQYNKELDERVVLFVKMRPGNVLTEEVKERIRKLIEEDLTYEHVPDLIIQVPHIPYNLTGKKLNLVVKKLINKMPVSNADFVINPESLEFYKNLDLGDF